MGMEPHEGPAAHRGLISPVETQAGREWTTLAVPPSALGEVVLGSGQLNAARV